jgi:hypothetical protein
MGSPESINEQGGVELTLLDKGISRETFNELVVKGFKEHGVDAKIEDINLVGWIDRDPK